MLILNDLFFLAIFVSIKVARQIIAREGRVAFFKRQEAVIVSSK